MFADSIRLLEAVVLRLTFMLEWFINKFVSVMLLWR